MRIRTFVVAVVATGLLAPAPAAAADGPAAELVRLVARERGRAGLRPLSVAADLVGVARRHVSRLAGEGRLFHNPRLGRDVTSWLLVGENVGRAGSAGRIHELLMDSPSHRANILEPRFREIGVATAVGDADGKIYMVQVFREPLRRDARRAVGTRGTTDETTSRRAPSPAADGRRRARPVQAVALLVLLTLEG